MSHFAEIDPVTKKVLRVIVAEQSYINKGRLGDPSRWVQTSYNTRGGVNARTGIALRKNYAGIGYTYDEARDAFVPTSPYPSWVLDEGTCQYRAPVPMPNDGKMYTWDEGSRGWKEHQV